MLKGKNLLRAVLLTIAWTMVGAVSGMGTSSNTRAGEKVYSDIRTSDEKMVLVYYGGGQLDVFPESMLASAPQTVNDQYHVTVVGDTTFCYDEEHIDSVVVRRYSELLDRMPMITQFKVNNKYNDQVYVDVLADIKEDSVITASIGTIGHWLTPSVQFSDPSALLYVGTERQQNKLSRRSFANDVYYTVAKPKQRIFNRVLIKDEVWSEGSDEYLEVPVVLTADMFSSNLPGQSGEGFAEMLDDNINTFFHSTWNVPQEEKETIYQTHPYIDIALDESLRRIRFSYVTRNNNGYSPLGLTLYASSDGTAWTKIKAFTADADNLPTGPGEEFVSGDIDLEADYSYLRFYLDESQRHLYLTLAEFRLWNIIDNPDAQKPDVLEPAVYENRMMPFGRIYRTHIDWLADNISSTPRIDINIENGEMVWSKDYYLNAEITIDGAGIYPSMPATPVRIKGRGNTSWSEWPWDKNPYRLKFEEKQKPFGLTKGKNWVLLANKQYGSMTSNAVGMKAACLVGTAGANHIVPVELYMNGEYRGNYNFTEKVGLANNSIDLDDESHAALLELDTYFDEQYKFRSSPYNLPVNVKYPEFGNDETAITLNDIHVDFNNFVQTLNNSNGSLGDFVDLEMLARYLMVNDLIVNYEIMHPKSTFLYKERIGATDDKFVFGPIWDLDWAFGYERNRSYFATDSRIDFWTSINMERVDFIHDLRYVSDDLGRYYYAVWTRFINTQLDELVEYCDDYYTVARPSLEHNAQMWGDGTGYARTTQNAKTWLATRAASVYKRVKAYDLDEDYNPIIDDFNYPGDTNGIETVRNSTTHPQESMLVNVYDLNGRIVKQQVSVFELRTGLRPGIYIVGGKKMVIK